jgi:two-component system, cell cycle sensor histidine kinase and response regulator CckA
VEASPQSDPSPTQVHRAERSRRAVRIAAAFGGYALAAGLFSFLGWVLDVPRLASWGGAISIQPNAALAATAAGAGLALLAHGFRRPVAPLAILCGLIGLLTLLEHAWGLDLGIDALLTFGRSWGGAATMAPGRMGPPRPSPGACSASGCWRRSAAPARGRPPHSWGSRSSPSAPCRSSATCSVRTRCTRWPGSPPSPCRRRR